MYSSSNFEKKDSFCKTEIIWKLDTPFSRILPGMRYFYIHKINPKKFIFVPAFYEGILFLYENNNNKWNIKKIISERKYKESYKMLNFSDYPKRNFPKSWMTSSGAYGKFLVHVRTISRGLTAHKNGIITHFVRSYKSKDNYELGVEIFDGNGSFIKYQPIEQQSTDLLDDRQIHTIMWQDQDDLIYAAGILNGFRIIRVLKTNIL